jgi:hypothetical protein
MSHSDKLSAESYTYGYAFSEELLHEWDWKEHYGLCRNFHLR